MKQLFIARVNDGNGNATTTVYSGLNAWRNYHADTFSPLCEVEELLILEIKGKTYKERKASAEDIAITYSNMEKDGMSWGECAEVGAWFEKVGKRYGLMAEFKENCIC